MLFFFLTKRCSFETETITKRHRGVFTSIFIKLSISCLAIFFLRFFFQPLYVYKVGLHKIDTDNTQQVRWVAQFLGEKKSHGAGSVKTLWSLFSVIIIIFGMPVWKILAPPVKSQFMGPNAATLPFSGARLWKFWCLYDVQSTCIYWLVILMTYRYNIFMYMTLIFYFYFCTWMMYAVCYSDY